MAGIVGQGQRIRVAGQSGQFFGAFCAARGKVTRSGSTDAAARKVKRSPIGVIKGWQRSKEGL
jgi:hypothetical protein